MSTIPATKPLEPGDPAPDVSVPAVTRDGLITLADYRGHSPVLLGLFRGLYCAFCRRHVVEFGLVAEKLRATGVETVAIITTPVDRARLYFRHRPPRYLVGSDPDRASHRAFGVPRVPLTEEIFRIVVAQGDQLARDTGLDVAPGDGLEALDRHDRFDTAVHAPDLERTGGQFSAQFVIDRDGIVRWSNIECAREGLAGLERFPTAHEFLAAARALEGG